MKFSPIKNHYLNNFDVMSQLKYYQTAKKTYSSILTFSIQGNSKVATI